jgi:hypothetical protein
MTDIRRLHRQEAWQDYWWRHRLGRSTLSEPVRLAGMMQVLEMVACIERGHRNRAASCVRPRRRPGQKCQDAQAQDDQEDGSAIHALLFRSTPLGLAALTQMWRFPRLLQLWRRETPKYYERNIGLRQPQRR